MAEICTKTTRIDSCDIHSLEAGGKKKCTVLLLHGMKFQAATWQETGTLEKLADEGFHAVAIDMPGFGKSPACSVSRNTVLHHFIGGSNLPVVLIGPSMGGRIALEFSISHPAALAGLVLIGPTGVRENQSRLSVITVPTLIVWGGNDRVSPVTDCDLLHESIPGSKKIVIDGAPHPCYLDNPEIWHRELIHFLNTID